MASAGGGATPAPSLHSAGSGPTARCGFVFAKRDRLKKPGRCPLCRGEAIREPLLSVREKSGLSLLQVASRRGSGRRP